MAYVSAPDGKKLQIPDSRLEEALRDGCTLLTDYQVSDLNQRQSIAARFLEAEQKRKQPQAFRLNRPRYR